MNVGQDSFNGTVAPDGTWFVFCVAGHPANLGPADYWISRRGIDGAWGPARHLGAPFNGPGWRAASLTVSPDGRAVFFASNRPDDGGRYADGHVSRQDLLDAHRSPGNGGFDVWWVSSDILTRELQ